MADIRLRHGWKSARLSANMASITHTSTVELTILAAAHYPKLGSLLQREFSVS